MSPEEEVRRAEQARMILESPVWIEAWELFRAGTLSIIEAAQSDDVDRVMQAKRLLFAGSAARTHLEALIGKGKVAQKDIEMAKERRWLSK
jgi:hypothetical protein